MYGEDEVDLSTCEDEVDLGFDFNDKEKKLENLRFPPFTDVQRSGAPSLEGAKEWQAIPHFAIVTGRNGTGKSHLLKYMDIVLKTFPKHLQVLFRDVGFSNSESNLINYHSDGDYFINNEEQTRNLIARIIKAVYVGTVTENSYLDRIADRIVKKLNDNTSNFDPKSTTAPDWEQQVNAMILADIDYNNSDFHSNRALSVLATVCNRFERSKQGRQKKCRDVSFLGQLFKFHCKNNQLNADDPNSYQLFVNQTIEASTLGNVIDDYIASLLGTPPWEQINTLLREINFTYELRWESKGSQDGTSVLNRTTKISTGEQIVQIAFFWRKNDFRPNGLEIFYARL